MFGKKLYIIPDKMNCLSQKFGILFVMQYEDDERIKRVNNQLFIVSLQMNQILAIIILYY